MAVIAHGASPRFSTRILRRAADAVTAVALKAVEPHRASLARLAEIPLTVMGAGCIDAAAFCGNLIAGLVVTGISLVLLEHMIADSDEDQRSR